MKAEGGKQDEVPEQVDVDEEGEEDEDMKCMMKRMMKIMGGIRKDMKDNAECRRGQRHRTPGEGDGEHSRASGGGDEINSQCCHRNK
eukprot:3754457-Pyramimonas_sp.AAC.1